MSAIALHTTFIISETVRDSGLVPKDHHWEMAYGVSSVVRDSTVGYPSNSLASYFYFLLFLMRHYAVNWCDKLRFCIYICCFIAGFSYRTRLVS